LQDRFGQGAVDHQLRWPRSVQCLGDVDPLASLHRRRFPANKTSTSHDFAMICAGVNR
jgi:hypothetical protein